MSLASCLAGSAGSEHAQQTSPHHDVLDLNLVSYADVASAATTIAELVQQLLTT